MSRVNIVIPRVQSSNFGLYRTSAGGDESIIVRRKVGEPTDVNHTKSRKLKRQRDNLTLATQHYSRLTPTQKAITRQQIEEVEYQKSHGKTDTKLLKGRQLFISKEMHSLETTQKQLILPIEVCIVLADVWDNPIPGELWLLYKHNEDWLDTEKEEIYEANWLFSKVPAGKALYHPYGEAQGYYDPEDEETTYLTEKELKQYHYHRLVVLVPFESQELVNVLSQFCQYWNAQAQLFMPKTHHQITKVEVPLSRWANDRRGNFLIKIETAEDDPQAGTLLTWAMGHTDTIGEPDNPIWKSYTLLNPIEVTAGQKLRLVVHTIPPWECWDGEKWIPWFAGQAMQWGAHFNEDAYERGVSEHGYSYMTGAGQWTHSERTDQAFRELGNLL